MKAIINDKMIKLHIYVTIYNYVACVQLSWTCYVHNWYFTSGNSICNIIYLELCLFGLHLPVSKQKIILGFDHVLSLVL